MKALRSIMVLMIAVAMVAGTSFSLTLLTGSEPALAWSVSVSQGFEDAHNTTASCMAVYESRLYVGTDNPTLGLEIWSTDGAEWTQLVGQGTPGTPEGPGFGNANNKMAASMAVYKERLYVGTYTAITGCEIWSYDGFSWIQVIGQGVGSNPDAPGFGTVNNRSVSSLTADSTYLYAGTSNGVNGCEVWAYSGANWSWIGAGGFGNPNNYTVESLAVYDHAIYAGTYTFNTGCEVWCYDGINWTPVVGGGAAISGGFGNANNVEISSMCTYGPYLYAGTGNINGCEVWRYDGAVWTQVAGQDPPGTSGTGPGFGDHFNNGAMCMQAYDSRLFVGTRNSTPGASGCEIWAYDGATWTKVVGAGLSGSDARGFGNPNNTGAKCMSVLNSRIYAGTWNNHGCEIRFDRFSTTWYLAEGATLGGYDTYILVQNPNDHAVEVDIKYQTREGEKQGPQDIIPPTSRRTYMVDADPNVQTYDVSTKVTASDNVICERAMYWKPEGAAGYVLGHDSIGVTNPAPTWYLAEGATIGGYDTYILVQNPNSFDVTVNIGYYTDHGYEMGPLDTIPAASRRSYLVNADVQTYDVSTAVWATGDVVCERAVYWKPPGAADYVLGTDSIGVTDASRTWYLAEGATLGGYETWILVQNPNDRPVYVDIKYQTDGGERQGPQETILPNRRRSFRVNDTVQTYDVSTLVTADGAVICERAMYWKPEGTANHVLGHDSIGVTAAWNEWYLAEGATAGGYDTYILVQNPGNDAVEVELIYQTADRVVTGPRETIQRKSRRSFLVNETVQTLDVSTKVAVIGSGYVICERAVYWKPAGTPSYVLGTNSIGWPDL